MSYKSFLWLIPFALTMWGCTESGETGNCEKTGDLCVSHLPVPEIRFLLEDLLTSVNESALEIDVFFFLSHDTSRLEAVLDVIRLTNSQLSPIFFTTSVRQSERYSNGSYTIRVIPEEALKDGWHTLSLASIPKGFALPFGTKLSDDGSLSIRFRTDSWPIVHGVMICSDEKVLKASKVIISFSEIVKMNESLERTAGLAPPQPDNPCESLSFEEDGIICTRVDGSEEILDMSNRVKMADALEKLVKITSSERDMTCQSTLRLIPDNVVSGEVLGVYDFDWLDLICASASEQDKITVEIAPGLISLEGVELKEPRVHQFVVSEARAHSDGCRIYNTPIIE